MGRRWSAARARAGCRRSQRNPGSRRCAERAGRPGCLRRGRGASGWRGRSSGRRWRLRRRSMSGRGQSGRTRSHRGRRFRSHGRRARGRRGTGPCRHRRRWRRQRRCSRLGCGHRRCHRRRSSCGHPWRRLLPRRGLGSFLGFGSFFCCRQAAKMLPHPLGMHEVDRARVRLLFSNTSFWEVLDQDLRLDLEFSGQFVNSDLIGICHSPLVLTAAAYLGTAACPAYVNSARYGFSAPSMDSPISSSRTSSVASAVAWSSA